MGEQSGTSQISHNSCLSLESGERGHIYSLSYEGIQQEATQGGTHPADPVVPFLAGGMIRGFGPIFHGAPPDPMDLIEISQSRDERVT